MTTIEEASARYVAAKRECDAAAAELLRLVRADRAVAAAARRNGLPPRPRRSWHDARQMAQQVQAFRAAHPTSPQREIAGELGITRDMVGYYLSPKCKASNWKMRKI